MAVRRRCQIHDALDRAVRCAQTQQVKKLEAFHEQRVAESKKKIEMDLKEASKRLYTKSVSKDERSRWVVGFLYIFL